MSIHPAWIHTSWRSVRTEILELQYGVSYVLMDITGVLIVARPDRFFSGHISIQVDEKDGPEYITLEKFTDFARENLLFMGAL